MRLNLLGLLIIDRPLNYIRRAGACKKSAINLDRDSAVFKRASGMSASAFVWKFLIKQMTEIKRRRKIVHSDPDGGMHKGKYRETHAARYVRVRIKRKQRYLRNAH